MKNTGIFWHVHHDVLLEYCYSYKERVDFIKRCKPKSERKTRLRLFKPVKNVPKWVEKANKATLWQDVSSGKYKKIIEALHRKECPDCPWDGKTIFPKEKAK